MGGFFFFIFWVLFMVGMLVWSHNMTLNAKSQIREKVKSLGGRDLDISRSVANSMTVFKVTFTDANGKRRRFDCQMGAFGDLVYMMPLSKLSNATPFLPASPRVESTEPIPAGKSTVTYRPSRRPIAQDSSYQPAGFVYRPSVNKEQLYDKLCSASPRERYVALKQVRQFTTVSEVIVQRIEKIARFDEDTLVRETAVELLLDMA